MLAMKSMLSPVRSSLPYQILLHCNSVYIFALFLIQVLVFIYKAILPYPTITLISEIVLLLLLIPIEVFRIFWAKRGNLMETTAYVFFSLLFTVPVLVALIYFIVFQTYVLMIEAILFGIEAILVLLEVIFGIIVIATFSRPDSM